MQYFGQIDEFVDEYHYMMVDENPQLNKTNDLPCLREVFKGKILEQMVIMKFVDYQTSMSDVADMVISNDDVIRRLYEDAIELTKFGCCC